MTLTNWTTGATTTASSYYGGYDSDGTGSNSYYDYGSASVVWKKTKNYKYAADSWGVVTRDVVRDEYDKLSKGKTYQLPDGGKLVIDDDGNYQLDSADAKVQYKANNMRDFSPHLNASDMVADFLKYVGSTGVSRKDMLGLPIELFLSWLVIEAAERDGDEVDIPPLEKSPALLRVVKPRCLYCQKYIKKRHAVNQFPFCDPNHARQHLLTISA